MKKTHVVWTLSAEVPGGPATWDTDGILLAESEAVREARLCNMLGMPSKALLLGKEPEQLHPSERPIIVRAS